MSASSFDPKATPDAQLRFLLGMFDPELLLCGLLVLLSGCASITMRSLVVEGPELHPSLHTRELKDAAQHYLAPVLRANPYLSTDREFVDLLSRMASQDRMNGEGVRAAVYGLYAAETNLGIYALEAASFADADRINDVLRRIWSRNVSLDCTRVHRDGRVFVVLWHDGVSTPCWEAANAEVVERLTAR